MAFTTPQMRSRHQSARALSPRAALTIAAIFNMIGAFVGWALGSGVSKTIQSVTTPDSGSAGLCLIAAALGGAIGWNLVTWRLGLPSSSTHALIGGVVGAALVFATVINWATVWEKVVIPMVASPFVGLILAFLLMISMGYESADAEMPVWIVVACAGAISLGTAVGGKRIMRTLGRRLIDLDPARGFAAESVAAAVLYETALGFDARVSTTQVITGSIMGAGVEKRVSSVRWSVGVNILWAWLLTLPCAAAIAAVVALVLKPLSGA